MSGFNLNFGEALELLKQGDCLARKGWNGKGMYIYLAVADYTVEENGEKIVKQFEPAIVMLTADKKFQIGWLASQNDILSEDWGVIEACQM